MSPNATATGGVRDTSWTARAAVSPTTMHMTMNPLAATCASPARANRAWIRPRSGRGARGRRGRKKAD
jgi:hypothetical protein